MNDPNSFWDREVIAPQHVSWMTNPAIREYINRAIGGRDALWPMDWFERCLNGRRFEHGLSIGCGAGALERDLIARGLCTRIDAFDGSMTSLHLAREEARRCGMADRIRYFAADFNRPVFKRRKVYDVAFFHQSAHHVAKLETLYRAILGALRPDALLYLDEYVGPSRTEWNDDLIRLQREVWASLPAEVRFRSDLPYPIQADDPSEAIRSSEIERQLAIGFHVLDRRPYGGTLLSVLYPELRPEVLTPALIERLIEKERALLKSGVAAYYTLIVARPRRGLRRVLADAEYFLAPTAKRMMRELRTRWGRT